MGLGLELELESNSNSNPNPNPSSSSSSISNSIYDCNPNTEFLTRKCNTCNIVKPLDDFDKGKYICRSCVSPKLNCPYCASIIRYDGLRAHVKKQHPDVNMPRGFTRNVSDRIYPSSDPKSDPRLLSMTGSQSDPKSDPSLVISQTEESCSCKYYSFVPFLINNGINIEKEKENINLLKSIDNLR